MKISTVADLKQALSQIKDDSLPIRLINLDGVDDKPNFWLQNIELSNTNDSGYEVSGEVRLISTE